MVDARKKESETKILDSLKEEHLTFTMLLAKTKLARSTLSFRLKDLVRSGKIEKYYNTYRLAQKGIIEIQIEGMIRYLGLVATHQIVRTKLNLPVEFDINKEIEGYARAQSKRITWKELYEFLQEKYPLTI